MTQMLEYDIREIMNDHVTIEKRLALDAFSRVTYAPPVTYLCRVDGRQGIVRNAEGQEVISKMAITLDRYVDVTILDRLSLTDDSVNPSPPIIAVDQMPDEHGPYYTVVYV